MVLVSFFKGFSQNIIYLLKKKIISQQEWETFVFFKKWKKKIAPSTCEKKHRKKRNHTISWTTSFCFLDGARAYVGLQPIVLFFRKTVNTLVRKREIKKNTSKHLVEDGHLLALSQVDSWGGRLFLSIYELLSKKKALKCNFSMYFLRMLSNIGSGSGRSVFLQALGDI